MGKRKWADSMALNSDAAAEAPTTAFSCPACTQMVLKWPVFSKHLQRCCPDLLQGKDMLRDKDAGHCAAELPEAVAEALQAAAAEEEGLREQLVRYHAPSLHRASYMQSPQTVSSVLIYEAPRQSWSSCMGCSCTSHSEEWQTMASGCGGRLRTWPSAWACPWPGWS